MLNTVKEHKPVFKFYVPCTPFYLVKVQENQDPQIYFMGFCHLFPLHLIINIHLFMFNTPFLALFVGATSY